MLEFLAVFAQEFVDAYQDCRTFSPGQWASIEAWFEHSGVSGYRTSMGRPFFAIAWAV